MNESLIWTILWIVVSGFLIKMMLEWFNQARDKPMVDLFVAISVFISVGALIIKGIQTAVNVLNSIPK
jgi:hypothetical protein